MRPVQPCRNFLSTNARTNDLKKAPVPDEPWEVVGDVNNGESDDLRVRNQEARVCHPLCPAVQVIWLFMWTSEKEMIRYFYWTRVRSLGMLVTNSLTDSLIGSLTDSCLVNMIDVTMACEDDNS